MKSLLKQVVVSTALVSVSFAGAALADAPKAPQLQSLLNLPQKTSTPVLASNGRTVAFQGEGKGDKQALFVSRLNKGKFSKPIAVVNSNDIGQSKLRLTGFNDNQSQIKSLAVSGQRLAFLGIDNNQAQGLFYAEARAKNPRITALAMVGQVAPQSKQQFAAIADPVFLANRQNVAVAFEARLNQTDAAGVYLAQITRKGNKHQVTLLPVAVPGKKLANKTIAQATIRQSIQQGRALVVAVQFTNGSSGLYQLKA